MMTIEQLTAAYAYEYLTCKNMRKFTKDNENDWEEVMEATLNEDGDITVHVDLEEGYDYFHTDLNGLLAKVNGEGWEMQDLSRDQKDDLEIMALPDVEPIEETTYTCKSGYVMKVWLVREPLGDMSYSDMHKVGDRLRAMKGWYDKRQQGFIVRSRRDAETLWNEIERGIDEYDREESRRRY